MMYKKQMQIWKMSQVSQARLPQLFQASILVEITTQITNDLKKTNIFTCLSTGFVKHKLEV